jgi:enamine deaminase RidA (YjgF/YER057c/UK114 family)
MLHKHICRLALGAALFLAGSMALHAQVVRVPLEGSNFPISQGVWVGDTLYLSGVPDRLVMKGTPGDTELQTTHVLDAIQKELEAQKLGMKDIVMMHAYLVGDPAKGGRMDFAGFMAAYTKYFGTKDQPNMPARTAMQIAALGAPGALVEIEVIAVKPK